MSEVKLLKKIELWKSKLLDFTKRNRLLNFKNNTKSVVKMDTDSDELFNMILNGQPITLNEHVNIESYFNKKDNIYEAEQLSLVDDIEKNEMKIKKAKERLEKQLNNIRLKGKSSIDEKGVNTLYLAMGFLNWQEIEYSKETLISPLILIPVQLKRKTARDPYIMYRLEEEIIFNPVLEQKLKLDFGINITSFDDIESDTLQELLGIYNKELCNDPSWEIKSESYIGLFSFSKLVMYKDFIQFEDTLKENPFVKELAGVKEEYDITNRENIEPIEKYDRKSESIDSFQILDADSSQQEAILSANNNVSFVMQGPPGTGKSQTIANIISESLAHGKKVLFVSEKRAALEVVKNRLEKCDLGDYILDLHSHNSNKKAILEDLNKTLNQSKTPQHKLIPYSSLDLTKRTLYKYIDALHTTIEPLNYKPQVIHGELAKLDNVPEIFFELPRVGDFNLENFNKTISVLNKLDEVNDIFFNENNHLWNGAKPKQYSNELQSDISVNFKKLASKLELLKEEGDQAADLIGYGQKSSLESIDKIQKVGKAISNKPISPKQWFGDEGKKLLKKVTDDFDSHKCIFSDYKKNNSEVLEVYKKEIFHEKIEDMEQLLFNNIKSKLETDSIDFEDFIISTFDNQLELNELFDDIVNSIDNIKNAHKDSMYIFGFNLPSLSMESLNEIKKIYEMIKENPQPNKEWFDESKIQELRKEIKLNGEFFNEYLKELVPIENEYNLEILNEDLEGILSRYLNEYVSRFRVFNKKYKIDKNFVRSFQLEKQKLTYDTAIKDLRSFIKVKNKINTFKEKKDYLNRMFGIWYEEEKTNWDLINKKVELSFQVNEYIQKNDKKDLYLPFILRLDSHKINELNNFINICFDNYNLIKHWLDRLIELTPSLTNVFKENVVDIYELEQAIERNLTIFHEVSSVKSTIEKHRKKESRITYHQVVDLFSIVSELKALNNKIEYLSDTFQLYYGELYEGLDTDWDQINLAIKWTSDTESYFELNQFPKKFKEIIRNGTKEIEDEFITRCQRVNELRNSLNPEFSFYDRIFNKEDCIFNEQNILNADLEYVVDKLLGLAERSFLLQDWVRYRDLINSAYENGLNDFIEKVQRDKVTNNSIKEMFLKRFYKLWLDYAYKKLKPLQKFNIGEHNKLLEQFKLLDKKQIEINGGRLHKILTKKKDQFIIEQGNKSSALAFLRREIQKQKRHKPIRTLFSQTPELLLTLKPCMMMSPMSASQFIDPTIINFDLIIYDEASQIRPEDAIGSIIRGKQIIIAGDNKQLPPTNFFSGDFSIDDEFIDEEDEDAYELYESILDECSLFMPTIPLKWHYRSKQETLISFSNRELYDNLLYTFPNSVSGEHDGISLIQVDNGIYDRGRSKRNIKEAELVAKLVVEHFKRSPDRSLGIIAFSEAQQEAIRDKVEDLRKNDPTLEGYFNENQFEAFFIKNLENVQGDERDTIILSIGYGKDQNGVLHYNFGPLNKDGGERRLNVAVTRAKYELKVVSSITDMDLDDAKLNKKGPRLLKAFLYYSRNKGEFTLNTGIMNNGDSDSPFEDDVYDMLSNRGLIVRKQVGCSGYRIDLAIVDPNSHGRYLIGVECDGATYHSSKTARDRDRLRQMVLESLGWRIYRIWSQDWYKRKKEITQSIVELVSKIKDEQTVRM
jgi:very-short-patch-repair endonuclease